MALKEYLTKMIIGMAGDQWGEPKTKEEAMGLLERVGPVEGEGGFVKIAAVVACKCGNPCMINATPPEHTVEEFKALAADSNGDARVIEAKAPGVPDDAPHLCASNMGGTLIICEECDQQFLVAWEFDCCMVSGELKAPGEDTDGPESSSSGESYTFAPLSKTLH
jgi:hypothetical protein